MKKQIKLIVGLLFFLASPLPGAAAPGASSAGPNDFDRFRSASSPEDRQTRAGGGNVGSLIAAGEAAFKSQRYDEAISRYTAALQEKPDRNTAADIYSRRCEVFLYKKQLDKAFDDASACIALNPRIYNPYVNRGLVYRLRGNLEKAIRDYDTAIRLNPRALFAFNNRGVAYNERKQYERAIQDFNAAIRLNPNYANAYLNRAVSYEYLGKFDQAIAGYTEAIRRDATVQNAHFNRGDLYYKLGDFDRAILDLSEAIRRNRDPKAYRIRAQAYRKKMQQRKQPKPSREQSDRKARN